MFKPVMKAAVMAMVLASPAAADATIGIGLSFAFGNGSRPDAGVGLRLFNDNKRNDFTGSVGVDYMFGSRGVRPTVGFAYLGGSTYVGADVGYDFSARGFNAGAGLGLANTRNPAPVIVAPAVTAP